VEGYIPTPYNFGKLLTETYASVGFNTHIIGVSSRENESIISSKANSKIKRVKLLVGNFLDKSS